MAQKPKNNSDAILALREVRELLLDSETKSEAYTRGGVKEAKERMNIQRLVEDKFYDGKIIKKTPQGMLIDINADSLGLLRWNLLRGIPKKLQKVGGFIGNLLVTKVDLESAHVNLKLQTIGFDHDTLEETEYSEVLGYLHYWSGLPEAPPFARQAPESPAPVDVLVLVRPLAPRRSRLNRRGKNGPRRRGGCWGCLDETAEELLEWQVGIYQRATYSVSLSLQFSVVYQTYFYARFESANPWFLSKKTFWDCSFGHVFRKCEVVTLGPTVLQSQVHLLT